MSIDIMIKNILGSSLNTPLRGPVYGRLTSIYEGPDNVLDYIARERRGSALINNDVESPGTPEEGGVAARLSRRLISSEVLPLLKNIDWRRLGASWVVVFGSLARDGRGKDVDLLIFPSGRGPWDRVEAALRVSEVLRVDPDLVDIVEAQRAPCSIIRDAWRHGVVIYEDSPGVAREWLLARVKVCHDYDVSRRRIGVLEEAVRAMRRRWGGP